MKTRKATEAEQARYDAFTKPLYEILAAECAKANFRGHTDYAKTIIVEMDKWEKDNGFIMAHTGLRAIVHK